MNLSEICLIRSRRRTLSLEMTAGLELRIRAPYGMRVKDIRRFVQSRRAWIEKTRTQLQSRHERIRARGLYWEGQVFAFLVDADLKTRFEFYGDRFLMHPLWVTDYAETVEKWTRAKAAKLLAERTEELAGHCQIPVRRFCIGTGTSRWGSCSRSGNIRLNRRLLWVPPQVRDYVIIHELCHRLEFNHSQRFWREVEKRCPDYQTHRAWLREHAGLLHLRVPAPERLPA